MRRIVVALALSSLVACNRARHEAANTSEPHNEAEYVQSLERALRQKLASGDASVCVDPMTEQVVIDNMVEVIAQRGYGQLRNYWGAYIDGDRKVSFEAVTKKGFKPEITEMSCEGTVTLNGHGYLLDWSVAPSLGDPDGVAVRSSWESQSSQGKLALFRDLYAEIAGATGHSTDPDEAIPPNA